MLFCYYALTRSRYCFYRPFRYDFFSRSAPLKLLNETHFYAENVPRSLFPKSLHRTRSGFALQISHEN